MARDRFRYFRIEAREILSQLGQCVLELEKGPPAPELLARLRRLAHTLKGAARVVKQQDIADLAHAVEDVLAELSESSGPIPRPRIDHLLSLLDDMAQRVAVLTPVAGSGPDSGTLASEDLFRAFRPEMHEMDGLLDTLSEAHGQLAGLRTLASRVEQARHTADLVVDHLTSPSASGHRASDRVTNQQVRSLAEELRGAIGAIARDFGHRLEHLDREFRETRSAAERLRLVPASALFLLLERTARDAAQAVDKQVIFEGLGGDVRLDAHVLAVAQHGLLQAVRNAVAHGIEPPTERIALGKPREGRLTLEVLRRGQRVVFSCRDDGRGIDLDAVRRLAHRKGLAPDAASSTPEEVIALLLKGTITTADTVTDLSGRGVGLDVLREAAERLGGEVAVRTAAGNGTTIELIVPLTLASFPGLLVESGGVAAILPLDAVRGVLRVTRDAVARTAQGQSLLCDGDSVPLASLAAMLQQESSPTRNAGPSSVVLIRGRTAATAALSVDRIVGNTNVVLRPLPKLMSAATFVIGASLDVAGAPQLVIDPDVLIPAIEGTPSAPDTSGPVRSAVLVIDDSLTTRMLEQSILESAGYVVDVAVSGEEGLQKARARHYSLFLVDVEMPGMDGFSFIERVRSEPDLRDIPSILVTSRDAPDDRRRGAEVGAHAYIVKSEFDQGVLLGHIRRLVG